MLPTFFKTKDKIVWFAIALIEDKYLSFPKYYFNCNGDKIKGNNYSKWFVDVPQEMRKYYHYFEGVGEKVFLVNKEDILEYYNPVLKTNEIMERNLENDQHLEYTKSLLNKMNNFFKISLGDIGVDGSTLLGDYKLTSDIDILVYGSENAKKLKNKFRSFGNEPGIRLFSKKDLLKNVDVPKTIYTEGFGENTQQSFEQFLRRYYGYINNKRFSIVCVPKENDDGLIELNRKIKKYKKFAGKVLILEDKHSLIVPARYKVIDENKNVYTLEIFNHYGINQAKQGEIVYVTGQVYINLESGEKYIINSFWSKVKQSFSLIKSE